MKIYNIINIPKGLSPEVECECREEYLSGYTAGYEDGKNKGFQSGYTSGVTDGIEEGKEEQKSLMVYTAITENGTYSREDGYNEIFVDVPTYSAETYASGYTDGYSSGYTDGSEDGFESGYTSGYTDGTEDGFGSGFTSGYTGGYSSGYTDGLNASGQSYESGYTSGYTDGYSSGYTDGSEDGYDSGYTSGKTDGYSSGYTDGSEDGFGSGYTSGKTDGYESGYTKGTDDGFGSGYTSGYTDGREDGYGSGYTSGKTDGVAEQKAKLVATAVTTNGTYSREDGFSSVSVNVAQTGHTDEEIAEAFSSGKTAGVDEQKAKLVATAFTANGTFSRPDGFSSVYVNVPQTGQTINNQTKNVNISQNGSSTVTHDSNYTGLEYVTINVNVPQTGHTDQEMAEAYASGITHQKSLLAATAFTGNGTFTRTDGWNSVTVNVAQTGHTDEEMEEAYESGYTSGKTDGVAEQKAKLSTTAFTTNGTYTRTDGWSAVTVNVSGYTQEDLDNAFRSGYTSGTTDGYGSGWTNGYASGYTDGYADASGETQSAATELSIVVPSTITGTGRATVEYQPSTAILDLVFTSSDPDIATVSNNGTINVISAGTVNICAEDRNSGLYDCETITVEPQGSLDEPLTMNILSAGTILWVADTGATPLTIEYQLNGGNWTSITSTVGGASIPVVAGDIIKFRGDNSQYSTALSNDNSNRMLMQTGKYAVKGNIMSLVDSTGYTTATTFGSYAFVCFFKDSVGLVDASGLILPAEPTFYCYWSMFAGCTNLTTAPELPATTLGNGCYGSMFSGCTSLVTAPKLPATALTESCYQSMFHGCTSLVTAPDLPALILVQGCYQGMFVGCTNLNYIKCMAISGINTNLSTNNWVLSVQKNSGTFIKDPNSTWVTGNNGIPNNWTIEFATS